VSGRAASPRRGATGSVYSQFRLRPGRRFRPGQSPGRDAPCGLVRLDTVEPSDRSESSPWP
jgi:hypothetical protein